MDISYIKKLIKLLDESGIDEIEIEEDGKKVRVSKAHHNSSAIPFYYPAAMPYQQAPPPPQAPPPGSDPAPQDASSPTTAPQAPEKKYHEVRSPIVGTFYRAPAPNADPYVEAGSDIQKGSVLCIIEAMKLMNEIESEVSGKVVQILVENGQAVEYNQPLFLVEPA
ncbi:MAG TPA: acetyl-CoA carboxylase biotin carboxyl carrier protein [Candidatus Kryptonia bacterium]